MNQKELQFNEEEFESYLGEICAGLGKVSTRFVEEFIRGIFKAPSLKLTDISRTLGEGISLHATHKRLCRNIASPEIAEVVGPNLTNLATKKIKADAIILVQRIKLQKKYARNMEYMDKIVLDQGVSEETECNIWNVVSCDPDTESLTPVLLTPFTRGNNEVTEAQVVLEKVRVMSRQTPGLVVAGRSLDHREILVPLVEDGAHRFMVKQRDNSMLLHNRKLLSVEELASRCETPYGKTIFKSPAPWQQSGSAAEDSIPEGSQESFPQEKGQCYFVHFGYLPVRLPECPDRPLKLLVIKNEVTQPEVLLTTEPLRRNRRILSEYVRLSSNIHRIGATNARFLRNYHLDDIRVLSFARLKNMLTLIQAASYFISEKQNLRLYENNVDFDFQARN
jgi:flagellar assembly factor FliW